VKERIASNLRANLTRVKNVVAVYDALNTPGPGRPSVQQIDVLRAAVVLLHATLEDLIRTSSEELLPEASPDVLNKIGFPDGPDKTKEKFTLGELHPYKGRAVDEVIRDAVQARLQRSNYNNVSEVAGALERIGLRPTLLDHDQDQIESLMKRRHLIVHRADKRPLRQPGRGSPLAEHLPRTTEDTWVAMIESVGGRILDALP
jgi:hypothetical protein